MNNLNLNNRKSYVVYRMTPLPLLMNDLEGTV